MPQDRVGLARQLLEANRSGPPGETIERAVAMLDPDRFILRSRITAVEGAEYRGHEGARKYFADIGDAFREWRNEPQSIVEVGSDAVLIENTFRGIGRDSGAEVELESAIVFVFSEGKVVRGLSYATREEALAALGADERP